MRERRRDAHDRFDRDWDCDMREDKNTGTTPPSAPTPTPATPKGSGPSPVSPGSLEPAG